MPAFTALFILGVSVLQVCTATNYTLGFMIPFTDKNDPNTRLFGDPIAGSMPYAIEHINENGILPNGDYLEFKFVDTHCDVGDGLAAIANFWKDGAVGVIGPGCTCDYEARLASALQLPILDYGCDDPRVSDKSLYPYYARLLPSSRDIAYSILETLKMFSWSKVSFIVRNDTKWMYTYDFVKELFEENYIEILHENYIEPGYNPYMEVFMPYETNLPPKSEKYCYLGDRNDNERYICYYNHPFDEIIDETRDTTRIYVFLGEYVELRRFGIQAYYKGLFDNGNYAIVGATMDFQSRNTQQYHYIVVNGEYTDDDQVLEASFGLEGILLASPRGPYHDYDYQQFTVQASLRSVANFGGIGDPNDWHTYGAYLYDAGIMMGEILGEILAAGEDPHIGQHFMDRIFGRNYESIMDFPLRVDANGNGISDYVLHDFNILDHPEGMARIGDNGYISMGLFKQISDGIWEYQSFDHGLEFRWPNADGPPLDMPICGFHGELCLKSSRIS